MKGPKSITRGMSMGWSSFFVCLMTLHADASGNGEGAYTCYMFATVHYRCHNIRTTEALGQQPRGWRQRQAPMSEWRVTGEICRYLRTKRVKNEVAARWMKVTLCSTNIRSFASRAICHYQWLEKYYSYNATGIVPIRVCAETLRGKFPVVDHQL